ncbi:MAG: hypothetical protein ACXWI4_07640 [Croceibacterium sp.]
MHIHLPKPLHGWREFVGEVGIIVIGVLLALGAEQAVEALHHRSQVHEMAGKLRAESLDNRHVIAYDLLRLREWIAVSDHDIAALDGCRNPAATPSLEPLPQSPFFLPGRVAWQGIRDSALLPLMPTRLVDNYWKIDSMIGAYETRMIDLRRGLDRTTGAVESMRGGARDREICNETLLALSELKQTELSLVQLANLMAASNEKALAGERIDAAEFLPRPGATH